MNQRTPFFYGWIIVFIGFLCVFMNGATTFWAMPVFVGPMSDDTGWSHTSILIALSVRFIMSALGGLFLGRFADKRGGAARILLFGVLLDAALLMTIRRRLLGDHHVADNGHPDLRIWLARRLGHPRYRHGGGAAAAGAAGRARA